MVAARGPRVSAPDATILTERLILRPHAAEDIEAYAPLWRAPPDGRAYTPVLDEENAWARLLRLVGHRRVFGFGPFLVVDRHDGTVLGEVGFARFRRGLGPAFDDAPEAMWIVERAAHGRGIAREAMTAATADLDARLGRPRSVCMIDPTNTPSLRLAARLGFRPWGEASRHGTPVTLFERVAREA